MARRKTTVQAGYGYAHKKLRKQYQDRMNRGEEFLCARCRNLIMPEQSWDLDHRDDRQGYLGPSHSHCNRLLGRIKLRAIRRHRAANALVNSSANSRDW